MVLQILQVRVFFYDAFSFLTYNLIAITVLYHRNSLTASHIKTLVLHLPFVATLLVNIEMSGSRRVRRLALRLLQLVKMFAKHLKSLITRVKTILWARALCLFLALTHLTHFWMHSLNGLFLMIRSVSATLIGFVINVLCFLVFKCYRKCTPSVNFLNAPHRAS